MSSELQKTSAQDTSSRIAEEYRILHRVAQILQASGEIKKMLQNTMRVITDFEELKVENKAGIFLADEDKKVLRLFTTVGAFSNEFLEKEKRSPIWKLSLW